MSSDRKVYLAACTIYRDDADYLGEWIEFHRLVGVERFVLYDNGSTDDHLDVLAPYLEEGAAIRHEWRMPFLGEKGRPKAMIQAFEHCVGAHRDDARWIAFLDVDEFLFSPTGGRAAGVASDVRTLSRSDRRPCRVRVLGSYGEAARSRDRELCGA